MKQILPELKNFMKYLNFAKVSLTKNGFRHVQHYISGLITITRKTIKQISKASIKEKHHSAIHNVLQYAKFDIKKLESRYLKKLNYILKNQELTLIFDDTLQKRFSKRIDESQYHYDHSSNKKLLSHQYFTSMIHSNILEIPLFPILYSENTESKIDMAISTIKKAYSNLKITNVICDSWYSDKKIIKLCNRNKIRVICGIKTNRKIKFSRKEDWKKLSIFTKDLVPSENYYIDETKYRISKYITKLNKLPYGIMLISNEYNNKHSKWSDNFHLYSNQIKDTTVKIIRIYSFRWIIETFHRDIKQNLGFNKLFMRKKEGIVRHSIFVVLAYIILKFFMFYNSLSMTIGECCMYIQNETMNDFILEIIEIEDKTERINYYNEVFINGFQKV